MCTDQYIFYACGCHHSAEQPFKVCEHARVNESLDEASSAQYEENENKCEEEHKILKVTLSAACKDCEQKMIERWIEENKSAADQNYGLSTTKEQRRGGC
jgi:hypothetical protein